MGELSAREFDPENKDSVLSIASRRVVGDHAEYEIVITLKDAVWSVWRRYSEFLSLDKQKFKRHNPSLLPPKKILGNLSDAFLDKRQAELESYIRAVLEMCIWLQRRSRVAALPRYLADFLMFSRYELHCIVDNMAHQLKSSRDFKSKRNKRTRSLDRPSTPSGSRPTRTSCVPLPPDVPSLPSIPHIAHPLSTLTPLQLWALTEKLKREDVQLSGEDPEAPTLMTDLLEHLWAMEKLTINGQSARFESSSIQMNDLPFSLHMFRSLKHLYIFDHNQPSQINQFASLSSSLEYLRVARCLNHLSDLLLDEGVQPPSTPAQVLKRKGSSRSESGTDSQLTSFQNELSEASPLVVWEKLTRVDLSENPLGALDSSVIMFRYVQDLNLSHCSLTDVAHLQHLPHLVNLDLSHNELARLRAWHTKLGNVKRLHLRGNKISSLSGLRKLYSLEYLDVRENELQSTKDVWSIGGLPCIESLLLEGNLIESSIDYRTRVFESFGERAAEVTLDGEGPTRRELDTVAVRLAIRTAREDRARLLKKTQEDIAKKLEGALDMQSRIAADSEIDD